MRFYNVDVKGKFLLERRASAPVYNPDDEGRMFYNTSDNALYYVNNSTVVSVSGNADCLGGQLPAYYLCADNATGTLPILHGGTGSTTDSGARTNLGLTGDVSTHCHDTRYGQLAASNTWTSPNVFCSSIDLCNITAGRGIIVCSCCTAFVGCTTGASCPAMALGSSSTSVPTLFARQCNSANGIEAISCTGCGLYACSTTTGVFSCGTVIGIYGYTGTGTGVQGHSDSGAAVSGNTAYCDTSSKYLKYTQPICISNCLKDNPLDIYYYIWEDSNYKGFNAFIGPLAEDFQKTFNTNHSTNPDEYPGLYAVDGVALGLAIENLKEIDKLKDIVTKLYSCIKKLEGDN